MPPTRKLPLWLALAAFVFLFTSAAQAKDHKPTEVPPTLQPEIDYLMALADTAGNSFDPAKVLKSLDFILGPKVPEALYHAGVKNGMPSAYHQFDVAVDLKKVLQYGFSPEIPAEALLPSSVRLSYWTEVDGKKQPLPRLWDQLKKLDAPLVVRGVEFNENTPDLSTGTYHAYNLHRTLILYRHKGHPVLLSLSHQKTPSIVGRKGAILGTDTNWDYLYSGEPGLTVGGLGWTKSYMYDSFSIAVFYQDSENPALTKCGVFKWLRAGWADVNMVKPHHIFEGMERFAMDFKGILENPKLPAAEKLSEDFARIQHLSDQELKTRVLHQIATLKQEYTGEKMLARKPFSTLLADNSYVEQLGRKELEGVLGLELMKCATGKKCREF